MNIHLDFFGMSGCSCPVSSWCKHMMAVLFDYAEKQGRSVPVLVNAKFHAEPPPPRAVKPNRPVPLSSSGLVSSGQERKRLEMASRVSEMSVPEWHDYAELCARPYEREIRNTAYGKKIWKAAVQALPSLEAPVQLLFEQNLRLFLLKKVLLPSTPGLSASLSYIGYFTHEAASLLSGELEDGWREVSTLPAEREPAPFIQGTLDWLRAEMLAETRAQHEMARHYLSLWQTLLNREKPEKIREEIGRLEAAAAGERNG
ncbi:hypothetical protein N6H14_15505 [Paenibacillus sp. CC-CFT747]|nr:hypothetical protein N6H14_15505 [Paenibacillus sp. CC-CFT747]